MKKAIAIIPARYASSRFPGKPLADICGKPMLWWVYNSVIKAEGLDDVLVAIDDVRIQEICDKYNIKYIMTSPKHDTPTSRLYEVSQKIDSDLYVFVGGDEPLINPDAIESVVKEAKSNQHSVTHAMTKIKTAPEVIDFTNIKVVMNAHGKLIYASRSPLPYPKGGLDYDYYKFVGIGAFSCEALKFYNNMQKSKLEKIEECDLLRFIENSIDVKMVEVECRNVSVDTEKDLQYVNILMKEELKNEKL